MNVFELNENIDDCPGHEYTDGGDPHCTPWCKHCFESEWAIDIYMRDKRVNELEREVEALKKGALLAFGLKWNGHYWWKDIDTKQALLGGQE